MRPLPSRSCALVVALGLAAASATGQTTSLTFDVTYAGLLSGYGDRVTGPMTGPWTYGGSGTYTPNVLASFGATESGAYRGVYPWAGGYNDLVNVIYPDVSGTPGAGAEMQITLTADPGHAASLASFDVGNWGPSIVLPYVRVTDESGAVLFEELAVVLQPSSSPMERNFVLNPEPTARILTLRIGLDGLFVNATYVGLDNVTFRQSAVVPTEIGSNYCTPGATTSSGGPSWLRAWGQVGVAANDVTLVATGMPLGQFGFLLASRTQGFIANPGGSAGNLCVTGSIGRFNRPGEIRNTSSSGNFELRLDLSALPTPTGQAAALPGQTWYFQAWHRDVGATSNFTDGLAIVFQ